MVNRLIAVALLAFATTAKADFQFETGTFLKGTGGDGARIAVTLGFAPKLMMFYHAFPQTTSGASPLKSSFGDFGFSDGTNDYALLSYVEAEVDHAHVGLSGIGAEALTLYTNMEMSVIGFYGSVCSLLVADNPGSDLLIGYNAWGGSDITNVKVGYDSIKASTGSQSYSGPGFQPDIVFLAMPYARTSLGFSNGMFMSFGAATGAAEEGHTIVYGRYGTDPTQSGSWQGTESCLGYIDTVGGEAGDTLSVQADFTQFETTGWAMNFSRSLSTRYWFVYVAVKGGAWKVGSETAKATTGTKATTGVGFTPSSLLMFGRCDTTMTGDSIAGSPRLVFGAANGTNEMTVGWNFQDNTGRDIPSVHIITTKAISIYEGRTAGSAVLGAEADWNAFGADGFTLDWTTADSLRQFIYIASGTAPPPETPLKIGPNGITIGVE